MRRPRELLCLVAATLVVGCSAAGGGGGGPAPLPGPVPRGTLTWPIKTRGHIDAWLHGFAMVSADTTLVPYFQRGYRDRLTVLKNRANVLTQLDLNRERITARLAVNRALQNAQFLALYFGTWEELNQGIDLFLQAEGEPRRASNPTGQAVIATFAQVFPTGADRDWLRLFTTSLRDEYDKFYRTYWTQQQRERTGVITLLDSLWGKTYYPRLSRFLRNTQLEAGDFILSLPLNGEGRTVTSPALTTGRQSHIIVTTFPETEREATEAIFVFAHEATATLVASAVNDNITPSEQRSGVGDRYIGAGTVQAGAMLLRRVAPELADGYARYYLRAANVAAPAGDAYAALANVFPIPAPIRDAIVRQLDVVLGGI